MTLDSVLSKRPDDIVILSAKRTPLCKGKKGGLKDAYLEELLSTVLRGVIDDAGISPDLVQDVCVGTVRTARGGASIARMAALHAGLNEKSTLSTVNRQCSSSLQAVWSVALAIKNGDIDIGIAAGAESMTMHYNNKPIEHPVSPEVMKFKAAADCLIPMGITNENIVSQNSIPRAYQDQFAASSYQKAEAAQKKGYFVSEIVPVTTHTKASDGSTISKVVSEDDGIRYGVTAESLAGIKPAFKSDGTTHAGNASQITDGAAAVLLARREIAERLGFKHKIVGKVVRVSAIGVPPSIMGVGPAYAIPKVLELEGLSISDVDFFEINEAFAGQCLYCIDTLSIPHEKVNPVGGAIALGHPLGATGTRQVVTGLAYARREKKKVFVTSMCAGTGFGAAGLFVAEL